MALSEETANKLPQSARRIIAQCLDDIGPTVHVNPRRTERIRKHVEKIITDLVGKTRPGKSGVITYNAISGGLRRAAEESTDPDRKVAATLDDIAQTIGFLTGQKEGMLREPRAFRPMKEEKRKRN